MQEKYNIDFDKEITSVLYEANISIVFSTYQAGRVMVVGSLDGHKLHQIPISFKKPMGIAVEGSKLAVAGLDEVAFFSNNENIVKTINLNDKNFDTVYIQRGTYNTSSLDIHDIHFGDGVLWGVNTLFSCICTFDINYNFRPKWKPNFISRLSPEDRCHLNGMAMKEGLPKYVTALSKTDSKEGWRKDIMNTGLLMEVPSSEIILDNLAMPHSPTLINNELYLLESGSGKLLKVNVEEKSYDVIYNFGRFVRGMVHHKGLLIIGASKIRETSKSFEGLDVKKNSKNAGIIIFDLRTKTVFGELNYMSTVEEIYDVNIIEGFKKPAIINQLDDRCKEVIVFPKNVYWRKPKST